MSLSLCVRLDSRYLQMVASFSPHRDTGGTLHLVSPSGIHHAHTSSALNQLRRSLSRSPSKGTSDFRLFSPSRLHSPSAKKAHLFSASLSPSRRGSVQGNLFLVPTSNGSSAVAIPYSPTSRIQRPGMRRSGSLQSSRVRSNPMSPTKRVLSESRDQGNAAPVQMSELVVLDDKPKPQLTPTEPTISEENAMDGCTPMEEVETTGSLAKPGPSRVEKRRSGTFGSFSTVYPVKRTDGTMTPDQVSPSNPSAKRRSLHGALSVPDFDVFDFKMGNTDQPEVPTNDRENEPPQSIFCQTPNAFSPVPTRSSSLRKSTLQQRQVERPLFGRPKPQTDGASDTPAETPMVLRSRQGMLFDSGTFGSPARDVTYPSAPFSNNSSSLFAPRQSTNSQPHHAAHPLSRTITQSSSSSSFAEDSPTHAPATIVNDQPKPVINFSKSLPAGAARPQVPNELRKETSTADQDSNFATPDGYKFAKPLPSAFMSTGLISKKNRDVNDLRNSSMMSKNMPDTPCKRAVNLFPLHRSRGQPSAVKPKRGHTPAHSWTPLNPPPTTVESGTPLPKGMGIFGSSFAKPPLSRRSSFVSLDGDDQSQSPSARRYGHFTMDADLPPTPTKQASWPSRSKPPFDFMSTPDGPSCKLSPIASNSGEEDDVVMDDSPSAQISQRHLRHKVSSSSIPRSHSIQSHSPSPLSNGHNSNFPSVHFRQSQGTKFCDPSTASPVYGKSAVQASPRTPQEHIHPPDPSGLSISAQNERAANGLDYHTPALPATPTGPREFFSQLGQRHSISLNSYTATDVDPSLHARFDKVELVGTGEFSEVYRVTEKQSTTPFGSPFCGETQTPQSNSSDPRQQVWAVKKAKQPYIGARDRERKNGEVEILKALRSADHVITLADSWDYQSHLYIQTEFCEEGSLDVFLAQVGLKARLDDFRIWKILLELSLVGYSAPKYQNC